MIALRHDESDAIIDGVLSPGELDRFYAWLDEWDKFLFREADFVVADKKAGSLLMRYRVQGRNMRVWVFSDTTDAQVDFMVNPDFIDIEDMADAVSSVKATEDVISGVGLPYQREFLDRMLDLQRLAFEGSDRLEATAKAELDEINGLLSSIEKAQANGTDDPSHRVAAKAVKARMDEAKAKIEDAYRKLDETEKVIRKDMLDHGVRRAAITILTALFHFHDRQPKVYEKADQSNHVKFSRHNDTYNPYKRLDPRAIVRPRNGTVQWMEQQRERHTESWAVKGHFRTLKAERYKEKRGQTIWVNDFIKGTGENMRESIYVDKIRE